jgi:hypothetical protein
MSIVFTYDENSGIKAGQSDYISQGGAYVGTIISAKWISNQNTKSAALELSIKAPEGMANYLSLYYLKKDGTGNEMGENMINAIMGLLKLQTLSQKQDGKDYVCPELLNKKIGLVLRKILKTKSDGSDTYGFEIVMPFSPTSRRTLREAMNDTPPTAVDSLLSTLSDKDERKHTGSHGAGRPTTQRQTVDDYDDIPL